MITAQKAAMTRKRVWIASGVSEGMRGALALGLSEETSVSRDTVSPLLLVMIGTCFDLWRWPEQGVGCVDVWSGRRRRGKLAASERTTCLPAIHYTDNITSSSEQKQLGLPLIVIWNTWMMQLSFLPFYPGLSCSMTALRLAKISVLTRRVPIENKRTTVFMNACNSIETKGILTRNADPM